MILVGGRHYASAFRQYLNKTEYVSLDIFCSKKFIFKSDEPIVVFASPFLAAKKYQSNFNILKHHEDTLFENFKSQDVIFLSSASVYGLSKQEQPFDESSDLNGKSNYALEKLYFENLIRDACANTISIRASGFFGEALGFSPTSFANNLKMDIQTKNTSVYDIDFCGEQIRDFTYINDIIELISHLVKNFPTGHVIYNYSSTEPIHIKNLVRWVSDRHKNIAFNFIENSTPKKHSSLDTKKIRKIGVNIKPRNILTFLK